MKRREFLNMAASGLAGAATVSAVSACASGESDKPGAPAVITNKSIKWNLASSFPRSLDTLFGAADVMAEHVKAMSGGKFEIQVYAAGELVGPFEVLDGVQAGSIQMGHTASYYYTGKNPALAFDTCMPFGLTARQQDAWLWEAGGLDLVRELYSDFNVMTFPGGSTGAQMGGWFRRDINSLEDLKGLKMRIPGIGGEVMTRLGVNVQVLPGGEIYTALERGAIDATEWVGPYDDEKLGFHKVVKNYYYPGWWEPGPSLTFMINKQQWEELPATYKEIMKSATQVAAATMLRKYDAQNPAALARLREGGVVLKPFTEELLHAARKAARSLYSEQSAADPAYKKIHDHWDKFRRESSGWLGTAELSYSGFAYGKP